MQPDRLTLNLSKCKYMAFNLTKKVLKNTSIKINIGHYNHQRTSKYKYLRIAIDDKLKSYSHIKSIKQCIFSRMIMLKKVRYLLVNKEALLLYKSKILPYYDLGSLFYESASADQVQRLQTLQNKCVKIIFGNNTGL